MKALMDRVKIYLIILKEDLKFRNVYLNHIFKKTCNVKKKIDHVSMHEPALRKCDAKFYLTRCSQ